MEQMTRQQKAMRISWITLIGNIVLSLGKLFAGIIGNSAAMISDAVHSASDVLSTVVVMAGIKIASRSSDCNHPYGHERFECVAALCLGIMLGFVGLCIGLAGVHTLIEQTEIVIPGILPLIAAIISIVVKEAMYRYTFQVGKEIHSDAVIADAWHHRSDAFSSIGSMIGIAGARMGFTFLDPLASLIICCFIVKTAYDITKQAMQKMVDHACDPTMVLEVSEIIHHVEGVITIDDLKTRLFGDKIYIDVEIAVDGKLSLYMAHDIAETVHLRIEQAFPLVKHCMVHVNPNESPSVCLDHEGD